MNVIIPKNISEYEKQHSVATKAENICNKLMSAEEREILFSNYDAANQNCDAVCLYVLYKKYGFTAEQLHAFFNEVSATLKAEKDADVYRATYGIIPQAAALKDELGVDIKEWYKEVE